MLRMPKPVFLWTPRRGITAGPLSGRLPTWSRLTAKTYVGDDGHVHHLASGAADPTGHIALATTNLLLQSQALDEAVWTAGNLTFGADGTAPDCTATANLLVESDDTIPGAQDHSVSQDIALAANTSAAFSTYVKRAVGVRHLIIKIVAGAGGSLIGSFDLTALTGAVTKTGDGTVGVAGVQVLADGWLRCYVTGKPRASVANPTVYLYLSDDGTGTSYEGDGASGLYVWGVQAEKGSIHTAYVPTAATTASRNRDHVTVVPAALGQVLVSKPFTVLVVGCRPLKVSASRYPLSIGRSSPTWDGVWTSFASDNFAVEMLRDDASQINASASIASLAAPGAPYCFAFSAAPNDAVLWFNGVAIIRDTSCVLPSGTNDATQIGGWAAEVINARVCLVMFFNQRLPDAILAGLTDRLRRVVA